MDGPGPDETLDALLRGRIRVIQPRRGPRVSLDALLLGNFAGTRGKRRIVDLGCGVGTVALALLRVDARATVVGVEVQPALAALARRNAVLNGVAARFEVLEADLRAAPLPAGEMDLVVSNPPFHAPSRPAETSERAVARQELLCTLTDVAAAGRRLLRARGELALIHPAVRVAELLRALADADVAPRVLRFVHSVAGEPALRVLALGARGYRGGVEVQSPLIVHGPDRRAYTEEAAKILGD